MVAVQPAIRTNAKLLVFALRPFGPDERPLHFGLPMQSVLEVAERPALLPIADMPDCFVGQAEWRGRKIPIADFAEWLGDAEEASPRTRMLVFRGAEGPVGLLVPGDMRMLKPPFFHQVSFRDTGIDSSCLHSIVELRDSTLALPDLGPLLG